MRNLRLCAIVTLGLALGYAFADAGDDKKKDMEYKKANCCVTAAKDGKTCSHSCCVEQAKEGNNCEQCGGKGKVKSAKDKPAKSETPAK